MGFPDSSVGKDSTCNAGDPNSTSGSGRAPGDRLGYPLQYSWIFLVAQLVKTPPAMQETWVRFLGLGRSPGEGKGYPLQYSGLENSMDSIVHGVANSQTRLSDFHFTFSLPCCLLSPCFLISHEFDNLILENKGQSTYKCIHYKYKNTQS